MKIHSNIVFIMLLVLFTLITYTNANAQEQKPELIIQAGHSDKVYSVVFSPDGKIIASGSKDKTIKLWDTENGKILRTLIGHTSEVTSVAFTPDGKTLATASKDKTIKLWNIETGKELRTLTGHTDEIISIAFSPIGKTLVSISSFGEPVRIWDTETGQQLPSLNEKYNLVKSIAFSPDGKILACGDSEDKITLWDIESKKLLRTLTGHSHDVNSVVFSPDGKTLASKTDSTEPIKLWDVESGKELRTFSGDVRSDSSISFSPDGNTLAGGNSRKEIQLWDTASGKELQTLAGHTDAVISVAFSPNKRTLTLASGSNDNTVRLWDLNNGKALRTLRDHTERVQTIAFNHDGKILASGSDDTNIKLWDIEKGKVLRTLSGHSGEIHSIKFSPDGKILASGSDDKTIKLWDIESGNLLQTLTGHSAQVTSVTFTPDGKTLISGSNDSTIRLWDITSGKLLQTLNSYSSSGTRAHDSSVESVAVNSTGKIIAAANGGEDKSISLWNIETGKEIQILKGHTDMVWSVAFSPDGKTLASGSYDKTVRIWDVQTGKEVKTFKGDYDYVAVAFSPDGKTIAAGNTSDVISLWDVESGKELRTLTGHNGQVWGVAFSPDGNTLASGSYDKTIKLWSVKKETSRTLAWKTGTFTSVEVSGINLIEFSPDGNILASGNESHEIKLWNIKSGNEIENLTEQTYHPYYSINFNPDGKTLSGTDGNLEIWDIATKKKSPKTFWRNSSGSNVRSVKFSPDGKTLAVGNDDKTITLWDVESESEIYNLKGYKDSVDAIIFSPDGKILASRGSFEPIKLWNVETGTKLREFGDEFGSNSISFSPDGNTLASGNYGKVKLWEVQTGKELQTFTGHSNNVNSVAFSPDGKILASGGSDGLVKFWDLKNGKELLTLFGHTSNVNSIGFSPDGKVLASGSSDAQIKLWNTSTGKELCSLVASGKDDWLVTTPEGLFDGSPNAWKQIIWRFDNITFNYAPVEAYFNDFFYPNLLQDIMQGKHPVPPEGKDLTRIDRRTASVNVSLVDTSAQSVKVKIEVKANIDKPRLTTQPASAGAQDVRLFRNGSLVKIWHGDVLKGQKNITLEAEVPTIAGDNTFTAYAFNQDNVKSEDSTLTIKGADNLKGNGTLYVLAIGINKYENPAYNLNFAVPDVTDISNSIKLNQDKLSADAKLKQYANTEIIALTDENATKDNILLALNRFADSNKNVIPQNSSASLRQELLKIKPTTPEDALVIYYAGHGTSKGERFYLLPHNFAGKDENALVKDGVSDIEINEVLEKVDAGKLLMAIDACQSGQALGKENEGRAPMNSKGLAQLAYDKGMLILTAAQSQQAALEAVNINGKEIRHGLLTYALLQGLTATEADKDSNNQLWEREWLDYAVKEVPQLQLEAMKQRHIDILNTKRGAEILYVNNDKATDPNKRGLQTPRIFYRREAENNPMIMAEH